MIRITNTLSGQKEEFTPRGDVVRMYVCGVTPYDESHIGHAMSYVIFDTIRRYLEYRDYHVRYVQNFTDVDDKIIARANKLGIPATELADRFIAEYFRDMDALNIRRADVYPRVTEEIPGIIEMVKGLVEKGHAYAADGDVYFRVSSDPEYGKLSHRTLESLLAGARVEVGEVKENPMDFALWKSAKPGEPAWDSPWGPGRPGWHIECSAMSLKHLGESIDIHGGGQDLIFPHHENELAQSESYTGEPFARYWLHNGLLRLGEEKMSKSLGNLVTVKEVLEKHTPDALRLFILSSHYRSPLTYTAEGLEAMQKGADRLAQAARAASPESAQTLDTEEYSQRFVMAMDDDFNTPQAIGTLFDLARDINRAREEGVSVQDAQCTLRDLSSLLGLTLAEAVSEEIAAAPFIELLIQIRAELRAAKQWALSDKIRAQLQELGVILEDSPRGTTWKKL